MSTTSIGKLSSSTPNNSNNNNNNNSSSSNNTNQLFDEENDNVSIPTAASNFSASTAVVSASGTCAESGGEDSLSSSNIVNKPLSSSPILATAAVAVVATTTTTISLPSSTVATVVAAPLATTTSSATTTTLPPQSLEQQCRLLEEENQKLKDAQARLQQQYTDAQRREKILMRKLAHKEQEFQDYVSQIAEYKSAQAPGPAALRATLLDPAVNIMFEKLKNELKTTKAKLEETQNELSAWKFTPDSNTGKRLMAKCRQLYQENEELGKMMSNGRLAKLEAELAMQKSFSEEVKKCQSELDDYLQELDEDVEGMQSTIYFLQQELKSTRDRIQILEKENHQLKNGGQGTDPDTQSSEKLHQQNFILNGKTSALLRTTSGGGVDGKTTITKNELINETLVVERGGEHDERTKKSSFSSSSGSSILSNMNMNTVIVNNTSNIMNSSDSNNSCNNITNEEIVNIRTARNSSSDIHHNGNNDINCDYSNEIAIKAGGGGDGDGDSFDCIDDSNNSGTVCGVGGGVVGSISSGVGLCTVVRGDAGGNNNFMIKNTKPPKKRNYDSDSSENSSTNDLTTRINVVNKKIRRSSVLSIDLNEEDTQIAEEDSDDDDDDEDNNSQRILTRRKSPRSLQSNDHI